MPTAAAGEVTRSSDEARVLLTDGSSGGWLWMEMVAAGVHVGFEDGDDEWKKKPSGFNF